jgi:transglutaminase-like putative cysteine protease
MPRTATALALAATMLLASGAIAAEPGTPAAVRSFKFNYTFKVKDVPANAGSVKVWVPVAPTNEWQTIAGYTTEASVEPKLVTDGVYGNQFLIFDFSASAPNADGVHTGTISYDVTRFARRPLETKDGNDGTTALLVERFLQPDSKVPLDGPVAAEALATTAGARDEMDAAARIYNHLVDTMKYDKPTDKTGWGQGDAAWACDNRFGNCTDFHSLFIGQARSIDIPARFKIGFSVPNDKPAGDIGGYHCWAEFLADGYGWLPVDASEANKHPEQREALFGGLDADRVEFVLGRDIKLPESASDPVNFIIYPHVEVDGKKHDSVERAFSYTNQ